MAKFGSVGCVCVRVRVRVRVRVCVCVPVAYDFFRSSQNKSDSSGPVQRPHVTSNESLCVKERPIMKMEYRACHLLRSALIGQSETNGPRRQLTGR